MNLIFVTQNEAPFRLRWMDELAKYANTTLYHVNEYAGGVNKKFINYRTNNAMTQDISKKILGKRVFDAKTIEKTACDVLILDGYGFLAQQLLIIRLRIKNRNFIMSLDGGFIDSNENWFKRKIKAFLMSCATAFLSTSKETDEFIRHYVGNNACIYRHLFSSVSEKQIQDKIDSKEKHKCRRELGISEKFTVIAVGKFIPVKGFDILIKALTYICEDIQLYFIGASGANLYEELITSDNELKIHFVDFCEADLLAKYYCASDVFILPSRGDVWGLVIGEAMAHGLPVISTNRCLAAVAMIEDYKNGFIVPVEDIKGLAEKICYFYYHPHECKKMGNNNLKLIRNYTIENAAEQDINNFMDFLREYGET